MCCAYAVFFFFFSLSHRITPFCISSLPCLLSFNRVLFHSVAHTRQSITRVLPFLSLTHVLYLKIFAATTLH
ncbi:hypothetical protein GGR55DRAFT_639474 [Xylaria sp. FL0064]|nr:hypothetical protein GGR55DRAFT_639474 [Xylaria sp. FL0064]